MNYLVYAPIKCKLAGNNNKSNRCINILSVGDSQLKAKINH